MVTARDRENEVLSQYRLHVLDTRGLYWAGFALARTPFFYTKTTTQFLRWLIDRIVTFWVEMFFTSSTESLDFDSKLYQ